MPKAVFILPNGTDIELEAAGETNLMQLAVSNGIHEIVGDCGGSASCATCHVYVEPPWLQALEPMSDNESQMLECTSSLRCENSRLSCQLIMTTALDGIRVKIADTQW